MLAMQGKLLTPCLINLPVSPMYTLPHSQGILNKFKEFKAIAVLLYVKGLSEQLCRCLQQQGVRAVFKSEIMLRSRLVRPKDAVDPAKQDGVVHKTELRSTIETFDSLLPRPPPLQSMPTTPDTSNSGTK